jgi:AraC-like DNA-binding protein/DNA gyrase inhibitor GyrI
VSSGYWRQIQRALDYIGANLDQPIRLADVARAAAFSEHHFHRIFRAVMDETVGEYVTRQRLQTAALMLAYHDDLSITEIGLACGYSSTSNFSKAFSRFFGVSPSEVRKPSGKPPAAISVLRQRYGHELELGSDEIDAYPVVYDDPALTSGGRCRYHACVRTAERAQALPEPLFASELPAGRYAVFPYRGLAQEIGRMYRDIYALWFPHSSLAPDTLPPIEHYIHDEPDEHGYVDMEIVIKVRPMRR